jgi:hypothetical protein
MRQLKRFCAVTLLSLAIGTSALAGDVQAPAGASPQPPDQIVVPTPPPADAPIEPEACLSSVVTSFTIELVRLISIF